MQIIEIFLPLDDNDGIAFPASHFQAEAEHLTERFGGLTAFTRAPAEGLWNKGNETVSDRIIIFEIMTETVDAAWWTTYRCRLETLFRQDKILIRATAARQL